ncbi:glucan endo-1,3-beta-glucosidase-like [Dioscorea cayenensis subsp. rotundata]|uniref:Glucan endo-1,3-beta-glucosidase-like n=1 Tax=Dioscorea cayennensis subsp. rotundata TaxID=55577 RepID=A0AB40BJ05_DIOCR|nr:glucan endo-1,3-beta-glucosidase-like [Dioscorea cayenensis subsp. rotundata]
MASTWNALILLIILSILLQQTKHAGSIGVNYGLNGDNLPNPATVVQLFNSHGIQKLRLFAPNNQVQQALEGTNIYVSLGVANDDLANLAGSQAAANEWVGTNILPFSKTLYQYVTVGNEAIPGPNSQQVAPAMRNIKTALNSAGLSQIMVTTVIADTALSFSFPPSQGAFSDEATPSITAVLQFLNEQEEPNRVLMVNVYPYFALAADPQHVTLEYAQFTAPGTVVHDHGLEYQNLFDAMVDAFYAAMENVGGGSVGIAVSETGWPNGGQSGITSPVLAETYNQKLIDHVKNNGTPKRPSYVMDVFVFAMFNENQKTPGVEQCFGLFYPNGQPVYSIAFT